MSNSSNAPSVIYLTVTGMHIPSFKNGKMLTRGRLITDPKKKAKMEKIIHSFVSQLRGLFPTEENAMRGECPKPSQIVLCLPLDDSLDWMIPGGQRVIKCEKGLEGCEILIERL